MAKDPDSKFLVEVKKKKKDKPVARTPHPVGFTFASVFDFSKPLGQDNVYRQQGAAPFGPLTATSQGNVDHSATDDDVDEESVKEQIRESLAARSEWDRFRPVSSPRIGIWSLIERLTR